MSSSVHQFGAATTTGSITIGGTAQTGSIVLGRTTTTPIGIGGNPASGVGLDIQPAITASSANAYGTRFRQSLTAAANNDNLYGIFINPTFNDAGKTGVSRYSLYINGASGDGNWLYSGPPKSSFTTEGQQYFGTNNNASIFTSLNNTLNGQAILVISQSTNGSVTLITSGIYSTAIASHSSAAGTKNTVAGIMGTGVVTAGSTGNVTIMAGNLGTAQHDGSGTITTIASFYGQANGRSAGTVSRNAGLYLEDQSGVAAVAANNYEIYANTTNPFVVRADSRVGIGTDAPATLLDVNGTSTFRGNLTLGPATSHIISSQTTAPSASVTGSGYSGAAMGSGSTDTKGSISATVGAAAGTLVVTFQTAYTSAPICTVSPASATAQVDVGKMYVTTSTTALTINLVATPTGGSEIWNYHCIE